MLKIAICDDEKIFLMIIESIIKEFLEDRKIDFKIDCYQKSIVLLEEISWFDIIFLDIDMPEIDGLEIAREIRKRNTKTKIIYVTSYTDYMRCAFEVHAFEYITKPFEARKLIDIMTEALDYLKQEDTEQVKTVTLRTRQGIQSILLQDIYYFEVKNHCVTTHLKDEKLILVNMKLKELAQLLEDDDFIYCHRSYLLNLCCVKRIESKNVVLLNGQRIPISQKKCAELKKRYCQYLSNITI